MTTQKQDAGYLESVVTRMALTIQHRGPDDAGAWVDAEAGIALGHRRLSIVDLSAAGHQPMLSNSGRFVLVYNGEVYNHLAIRQALEQSGPVAWRGSSDTETLLAAFERWGVEASLKQCVGMFAIALWDRQERTLHLARDRFGEKPLYYGWVGEGNNAALVFGSELKALRAYPGFANPISREALALYLRFLYVPAPYSIYQGIYKLEPGCLLSLQDAVPAVPSQVLRPPLSHGKLRLQRWWSLASVVEQGAQQLISDEGEAIDALSQSLQEAVKLQMLADVPLGAFLSGGVDSSTIVALMQQQSSRAVKTFTVGFEESGFDESPHALAVARHLGTDHTELFVTSTETQAVIPQLPTMYDEPFADSSQIPTHLVCRAAREHVTVALSGDAGDELFGGYNRYFWGPRIWNKLAWLPFPARQVLGSAIKALPVEAWDAFGGLASGSKGIARLGDKAHKLAARLHGVRNMDDLYLSLVTEWQDPAQWVMGNAFEFSSGSVSPSRQIQAGSTAARDCRPTLGQMPETVAARSYSGLPLTDPLPALGLAESPLRMMYLDSISYLPDDILCKVDRAAMAIGLETRVPFLDHRVAELAWRLPLNRKIRANEGKWALRQVLYRQVPRELIERPKAGFGIPVGQWLRGPLRDWAEALLDESRLTREGYFHPKPIRETWRQHLSGRHDWIARLWGVLMFQAWLEDNG